MRHHPVNQLRVPVATGAFAGFRTVSCNFRVVFRDKVSPGKSSRWIQGFDCIVVFGTLVLTSSSGVFLPSLYFGAESRFRFSHRTAKIVGDNLLISSVGNRPSRLGEEIRNRTASGPGPRSLQES